MNFLQTVPRSPWCPIQNHLDTHGRRRISRTSIAPFSTFDNLGMPSTCFYRKSAMNRPPELKISVNKGTVGRQIPFLPLSKSYPSIIHSQMIQSTTGVYIVNAYSGSSTETSGAEKIEDEKSEIYSTNMTEAMGAVLTYRHELGMNYNFIRPDLIVGSCLQTPADVDKLRKIGVKTVFCLQQDSDLEYFGVDINAIREYAEQYNDIEHLRAEIRDFDAFDLRMRLPSVVSKLYKAINRNGGVTYVHCTAGLGRAPAVTLAYMFWVQGYKLSEANKLLQSKRSCFPKLEAVKSATADILTGLAKNLVTLKWKGHNCSSVEISGLDIGWGQKVPLKFDKEKKHWVLERELPEGCYEYKYIVDGEWTCEMDELVTLPNKDGHVNNYINVDSSSSDDRSREMRKHLMNDNVDLTKEERSMILRFLEACQDDD